MFKFLCITLSLSVFASSVSAAPEESFPDRYYREGHEAWTAGQWQAARNGYMKYIAWADYEGKTKEARYEEARRKISEMSRPSPVVIPSPVPVAEKPAVPERKKVVRTTISATDIIRRAVFAKDNGRYDEAMKLYRKALEVEPGSTEARQGIEELEKEMN